MRTAPSAAVRRAHPARCRERWLLLLSMSAVLFSLACLAGDTHVTRNLQLPVPPGARRIATTSNPYRDGESGPIRGYGTRATYTAAGSLTAEELLRFYEGALGPGWTVARDTIPCVILETGAPCPGITFLRASRGRAFVSIDPANLGTPMDSFDVYVDHDSPLAAQVPAAPARATPTPTPAP